MGYRLKGELPFEENGVYKVVAHLDLPHVRHLKKMIDQGRVNKRPDSRRIGYANALRQLIIEDMERVKKEKSL